MDISQHLGKLAGVTISFCCPPSQFPAMPLRSSSLFSLSLDRAQNFHLPGQDSTYSVCSVYLSRNYLSWLSFCSLPLSLGSSRGVKKIWVELNCRNSFSGIFFPPPSHLRMYLMKNFIYCALTFPKRHTNLCCMRGAGESLIESS